MTNWHPEITRRTGPRYKAIADALAEDIARGRLAPGTRLPTHRELAYRLKVTVGTVTRAYAEAERRGLVAGEVGRGTYVLEAAAAPGRTPIDLSSEEREPGLIDLSKSVGMPLGGEAAVAAALRELSASPELPRFLEYQPHAGLKAQRAAGSRWLSRFGVEVPAEQVVVTTGGQNAMAVAALALIQPGDLVLTEALTHPGLKALCNVLHLRLHGVEMDEEGMRPDSLDAACRLTQARVVYLVPTLHNPTSRTMSAERRADIAAVARRHDLILVEDDVFGCLAEAPPPPLIHFAPERTIFLTALSKSVAAGLRVGYLAAAPGLCERMTSAIRATMWMTSPLTGEVARLVIENGAALRAAQAQREEARARQRMFAERLGRADHETAPASFHVWLRIPEPWHRDRFVGALRRRGVAVTGADAFAVGRTGTPHAARVSLSGARSREELARALDILADLLAERPSEALSVV